MKRLTELQLATVPLLNGARLSEDFGNLLVLAPHPDDESLGCGGLISMLKEGGGNVSVVFVTSGSASHPNSRTHPPELLSRIRESEAIIACSKLGVPNSGISFIRAPDSCLEKFDDLARNELIETLGLVFETNTFSAIALPWRRDPHPDHRAVYSLGKELIEQIPDPVILIEYPIWLWKNGAKKDWPIIGEVSPYRLNVTEVFEKKWKAIQSHESQLGRVIDDDPYGFVLTEELLEPFNKNTEYFFITNLRQSNTLGGDYFEDLYQSQEDPWNFKNSRYEHIKYRNCVNALGNEYFNSALELGCSIGVQTAMLSQICRHLTAVDISEAAIRTATEFCESANNIDFLVANVVVDFPHGEYDLITCCEMGYYLEEADLKKLFVDIRDNLQNGGKLLMVHWTAFVPDYPLSGDAVHTCFESLFVPGQFEELVSERHEHYRLEVWRKSADGSSKNTFTSAQAQSIDFRG